MPELLQRFLLRLETTETSRQVWRLLVTLGRELQLPYVDFISASSWHGWKKTRFIRTSYDASWVNRYYEDPEMLRWSYFRSHAMNNLTPLAIGLEFADEYKQVPKQRLEILREAARRGIRAGYSIPLRCNAPPQSALISFSGDHSRRDMLTIINAHGWTLTTAALTGHQRYLYHFGREFAQRNRITPKQLELLELLGDGLQDKQIADRLGVSISAVRQRMHALSQNTGMTSRAELAALAMSLGVLPDPLNRPGDGEAQTLIEMDDGGAMLRTVVL
ncbi:autoinducer binding domain-containing protein [Salipiger abyssi]|uniref:Transcriptional regulator, luxR family n=1 Tax=Salipiger abyssi TaxID=1250539 RepID=A0A1P8UV87_9RHOB|nr:autoinducer binding domain-containing protein [Salipiger abyssi]APZ53314.1 transcriptional regulator, luxR family [Salipiger abyssi]